MFPKALSALFISLLVAPQIAIAAPTVTGNMISVDDDGWYQFQSVANYATICEGVSTCEVENGTYNVINLTTQVRYEGILVRDSLGSTRGEVTVEGNVINWPDDGWYQVQSATDYSTVCQGVRSCTVEAGSYIVINHTNNVRFEPIIVMDGSSPGGEPVNAA